MLFDSEKLKAYTGKDGSITYENYCFVKTVEGQSFEQTVKSYGAGMSIEGSGSYGMASFSGSCSAEFNTDSTVTKKFKYAQIRKIAQYARISLPTSIFRDDLRSLLLDKTKNSIDSIQNISEAMEFVKYFGPFYIQTACLGALLTISSTQESTDSNTNTNLTSELNAELSYMGGKGSVDANFKMGSNQSKQNSSLTYNLAALGGDPSLILSGDETAWMKSAKSNLCCVDVNLATVDVLG